MGPLLSDLVGLDVRRDILNSLADAFDEIHIALINCLILVAVVSGKKTEGVDWIEGEKSDREDLPF